MSKPKLKAVKKYDDSWQHCCRYCKSFENGRCWNRKNNFALDESTNVYRVAEEGYLSQTLEETLNNEKLLKGFLKDVEQILDEWKISQKRKKQFEEHFIECWGEFADFKLKEELDEKVSICYQNHAKDVSAETEGIEIEDPSEFCCKEWS